MLVVFPVVGLHECINDSRRHAVFTLSCMIGTLMPFVTYDASVLNNNVLR